jgi:hypothetical protein
MNTKSVLVSLFGCLLVASAVFAQGPVVIFDPLRKASETKSNDSDEQIVETLILPKIKDRWSGDTSCDGSNLTVIGSADGSFTKKAAAQRAILYEMCQTGNGFANNGIAIVENGIVVANFIAEGGWNVDIVRIADIDKNGYDEIAIETGGGMHQGYTGSSTTVVEVSDTMVKSFGTFLTYTNECESLKPDEYCDRSYKITATPGKKLSFFSQKYINNGNDEEPKWVVSGKAKAAKTIAGVGTKYTLVK